MSVPVPGPLTTAVVPGAARTRPPRCRVPAEDRASMSPPGPAAVLRGMLPRGRQLRRTACLQMKRSGSVCRPIGTWDRALVSDLRPGPRRLQEPGPEPEVPCRDGMISRRNTSICGRRERVRRGAPPRARQPCRRPRVLRRRSCRRKTKNCGIACHRWKPVPLRRPKSPRGRRVTCASTIRIRRSWRPAGRCCVSGLCHAQAVR